MGSQVPASKKQNLKGKKICHQIFWPPIAMVFMEGQSHACLLERYWANTRVCHYRTSLAVEDLEELRTQEPSADEEKVDADENENKKSWSNIDSFLREEDNDNMESDHGVPKKFGGHSMVLILILNQKIGWKTMKRLHTVNPLTDLPSRSPTRGKHLKISIIRFKPPHKNC